VLADQLTWLAIMIYGLWLDRNEARNSRTIEDPRALASRTVALTKEWHVVQAPNAASTSHLVEQWLLRMVAEGVVWSSEITMAISYLVLAFFPLVADAECS
jgi:hypothetical protein